MASQYAARLGVLLSLNTAEFSKNVDDAIAQNRKLKHSMERELKAAAKEVQTLEYAIKDYGREVSNVEKMQRNFAQGGKFEQLGKSSSDFQKQMLAQAAAMDAQVAKFRSSQKALSSGFQMTAQQMAALGYQTTDIVTGLVSGQSPFMVLIQQGGQLRDQFGSFANVFRGFASVITLARVAAVGFAGSIAAIGYAFIKATTDEQKFNDALILSNNTLGLTHNTFSQTATEIAGHFNTKVSEAKDALIELSASGTLTREQLTDVGVMVSRVAQLSGKAAGVVAKELAPSLNGTAKGAEELNKKYHFLTLAEYKRIEALEILGRKTEALKIITEKFTSVQNGHKRDIGYIQSAWEAATKALSDYKDALLEIGTEAWSIKNARSEIERLEKELPFTQGGSKGRKEARIAELKALVAKADAAAKAIEDKAAKQQKEDQKISGLDKAREFERAKRDMRDETIRIGMESELASNEKIQTDRLLIEQRLEKRTHDINTKYNNMKADDAIKNAGRLSKDIEAQRAAALAASNSIALQEKKDYEKKKTELEIEATYLRTETEIANRKATATALQAIDLETEEKAMEAWRERDRLNKEERGTFAAERNLLLEAKLANIRAEGEQKKAQISRQAALEIANEQQGRLNNIELQREEIKLYSENLLASEKDLAILKAELAYKQEIAKIDANEKLRAEDKDAAKERAAAIRDSSKALAEEAENLQYLQDMNKAVFSNMESAIVNFVKTGKLSFKDLAASIISDLMVIYIKAQATRLLGMLIGGQSFMGATNVSLGGLGTIPGSTQSMMLAQQQLGVAGLANGGMAANGTPYLVGENGPELFMPNSSGTIVPNARLGSATSSPQIIYNGPYIQNMSAIDTQSGAQFLARNKMAVWSANQSAGRSIPQSR